MQQLKIYKLILCLAAIVFIARPFIGFNIISKLQEQEGSSVIVKIFSKRKPEFLDEAIDQLIQLQQAIRQNAITFLFTIDQLLATLFLTVIALRGLLSGRSFITSQEHFLRPVRIYLMTGQLTI